MQRTAASSSGMKQHCHSSNLVLQMHKYIAELTLAPFGDEILPVRFQGSQINAFPVKQKSNLPSIVPLGMSLFCNEIKTGKIYL